MPYARPGGTATKSSKSGRGIRTEPNTHPAFIPNARAGGRLSPVDVIQLQRKIGNQAVCRLLQTNPVGPAPGARSETKSGEGRAPDDRAPARAAVQRRLQVDSDALPAASGKAKADQSTYTQIHMALRAYHNVPREYDSSAQKASYQQDRVGWLVTLDALCRKWLEKHPETERRRIPGLSVIAGGSSRDLAIKRQAVQTLLGEVTKDLIFSGTFQGGSSDLKKKMFNALVSGTGSHKFLFVKNARKELMASQTPEQKQAAVAGLQPGEPELLETYKDLRDNKRLASKEVKAIGSYTGDQFSFMNPVATGAVGWLAGQMEEKQKNADEASLKEAIEINQIINKVAVSGLQKLPPWKQDKIIYRGETLTAEEGGQVGPGFVKLFPHLVSTSQGPETPRSRAAVNKSDERPIAVIWHIMASRGGRDVGMISESQSEQEVLFPPGTKFTYIENVKGPRGRARADHMEVKVKAEAPDGF